MNSIASEQDSVSGTTKQKEKRQEINDILTAPDYQANLEKCLVILKPIDKWIKLLQSDQAEVSIVYKAFYELPGVFEQLSISDKENKYSNKLSKERFDFIYGDACGAGCILDPRYIGDGMCQQVSNKIEDFIFLIPNEDGSATTEEEKVVVSQEYTQWKIKALMA